MKTAEVKGLPGYVKVLDVSEQDKDPHLDFTGGKGDRVADAGIRVAVPASDYATINYQKAEQEQKAILDENAALKARIAELEAAQKPAEPVEPAKIEEQPANSEADSAPVSNASADEPSTPPASDPTPAPTTGKKQGKGTV